MHRWIFVVVFAGLLLALSPVPLPTSSPAPSSGTAEAAPANRTGKITGTFHKSSKNYIQIYDAVTTADVFWVEDPDFFSIDCNCRPFFPVGDITWSYRYEVKSESIDCIQTVQRQVQAGTGGNDPADQMIVFWEVPGDDTKYYFSGDGGVEDSAVINCEGEGPQTVAPIAFLNVPAPEIEIPTPSFPGVAVPAAGTPLCDDAPITVARDATTITGSCYEYYYDDDEGTEFVRYEWNLQVCPGGSSPASHLPPSEQDKDGDHIPDNVEDGIGTDPLCPDTDGDGLLDPWEVEESVQGAGFDLDGNGVAEATRDEVFGPYSGQCGSGGTGARRQQTGQNCELVKKPDPLHKDVYVEMDWQDCLLGDCPELVGLALDPSHHAPDMAGLRDVVNTFKTAPVPNPDGSSGVNLHILVDEAIPHAHNCDRGTAETRATNFGTTQQRASPNLGVINAKYAAVRYAWSGHSSVSDFTPSACPLPSFSDMLLQGMGLKPLPFYDISPHGYAQPRGRDILVTLAISWICQLYTFDAGGGAYLPPCFRSGPPFPAPGLFKAKIAQAGGGPPVDVPVPMHIALGVSPSQGVRQLWGRSFMNLLGYSMGVPAGSVGNDPNVSGAHPPTSYAEWEDLAYAPPRIGPFSAQGGGDDFVPIFPDFTLAQEDGDGDGTAEGADNCPALANPSQADLDGDGLGDACDDDEDGDGLAGDDDDAPGDTDNDGTTNSADGDDDDDSLLDVDDNCPLVTNTGQANADGDDEGDVCDPDADGDGLPNSLETTMGSDPLSEDNGPEFLGYEDTCGDGSDNDGDGDTDAADDGCLDSDGDTVPNSLDNCPGLVTINLLDSDGDGQGDLCEPTGTDRTWGDVKCDGNVNLGDSIALARHLVSLDPGQSAGCPAMGGAVTVGPAERTWGDVDCSGTLGLGDAIAVARFLVGIVPNVAGCPTLGSTVQVQA